MLLRDIYVQLRFSAKVRAKVHSKRIVGFFVM